ncbi:MAG: DUF2267 domain-containing protein [bacterium]
MNCEQFVHRVQNELELAGLGESLRAIRAVLETLGERLPAGEAKDLASNLPMEIDRYLLEAESGQRFDYREFVTRVSDRGHVDPPDAAYDAQQILAVVSQSVPAGERDDVKDALPEDFDALFDLAETRPVQ